MLVKTPLWGRTIIAPVFIDGYNLSVHHTNKWSGMVGGTPVLTEHRGCSKDMRIGSNAAKYWKGKLKDRTGDVLRW